MYSEGLLSPIHQHTPTKGERARALVEGYLDEGKAVEIFLALKVATADTEFKVGMTDDEDLTQMSPARVRDYIAGLEIEELALVDALEATNACDSQEGACVYGGWRTQLYVRIANELGPLSVSSDTKCAVTHEIS